MQKRESGTSIDTFLHKIISLMGDASVRPLTCFNSRTTGWSPIIAVSGVRTLEVEARILF